MSKNEKIGSVRAKAEKSSDAAMISGQALAMAAPSEAAAKTAHLVDAAAKTRAEMLTAARRPRSEDEDARKVHRSEDAHQNTDETAQMKVADASPAAARPDSDVQGLEGSGTNASAPSLDAAYEGAAGEHAGWWASHEWLAIGGGALLAGAGFGISRAARSNGEKNSAPEFHAASASTEFQENGSGVVYQASAADIDGDTLTYSISGADAGAFVIDAVTGELTFTSPPDYEARTEYNLVVTASDPKGGAASQNLTVTILDANEAPAFAAPSLTRNYAEGGSGIVFTASATDPDAGDTLVYSLNGADALAFDINSHTGAVTFKAPPDYETKSSYTIQVKATDSAGLSAVQDVAIHITDVAETQVMGKIAAGLVFEGVTVTLYGSEGQILGNAQVDSTGHYEIRLSTNYQGTVLAVATDANDTAVNYSSEVTGLSYTLTSDLRAVHVINTAADDVVTLNITPATELSALLMGAGSTTPIVDAATINDVNRAVGVKLGVGGDGNVVTSDVVTVDRSDFPDASAVAQSYGYALAILAGAENEQRDLSSTDPVGDSLDILAAGLFYSNGDVHFKNDNLGVAAETTLKGGAQNFDDNAPSGTPLKGGAVQFVIDHGTLSAPMFVASERATTTGVESGGATALDTVAFLVNFSEALAATPTAADFTMSIPGAVVTSVTPVGSSESIFSVQVDLTGATQDGMLSLGVAAANSIVDKVGLALGSMSPTGLNQAYVVDRINEAPSFAQGSITKTFAENATGVVFTASASDPDPVAAHHTLSYSLGGVDAADFTINATTGAVSFVAPPNFESKASYAITVTASDGTLSDSQDVTVNVTNVNEAPSSSTVSANAAVVNVAYTFDVSGSFSDPDAGDTLSFSASGLPSGLSIDASTGVISGTTSALGSASVSVTATDEGGLSTSQSFSLAVLANPTITSLIDNVANLDVQSNIVLTASDNVTAESGKQIRIIDDSATGFHGETVTRTYTIDADDTSQITILNNKIIINPTYDLDLSSNYHIEIDAGAFTGASSSLGSVAISDMTTLNFSTVTPGSASAGGLASAVASQSMTNTGSLAASHLWLDISGIGNTAGASAGATYDLSAHAYSLVFVDGDDSPGDSGSAYDGVTADEDFWVALQEFGEDDQVYVDDQAGDLSVSANDLSLTSYIHDGNAPTEMQFAGSGAISSQSWIDVTVAGSTIGYDDLAAMAAALGGNTPVISG